MLESYFKRDQTRHRLRAEPTGRYMDNFTETLVFSDSQPCE